MGDYESNRQWHSEPGLPTPPLPYLLNVSFSPLSLLSYVSAFINLVFPSRPCRFFPITEMTYGVLLVGWVMGRLVGPFSRLSRNKRIVCMICTVHCTCTMDTKCNVLDTPNVIGGRICGQGGRVSPRASERSVAAHPRVPGSDGGAYPFGRHVGVGQGAVS